MSYTYFLETVSNTNIGYDLDTNILYILCYHIETECKYPFLQFLMEKIPFCNNVIKEEFVLPHINIVNNKSSIKKVVLDKVKDILHIMGYETNKLTDEMYKGVVWFDSFLLPYVLVNISNINKYSLYLNRKSTYWFILPSEIINTKEVYGIGIGSEVTTLFIENPCISLLTNSEGVKYILPDPVYTLGDYKLVEFSAIFGISMTKLYDSCGEYYYFYRSFSDTISSQIDETLKKGLNRYALFVEGELYMELANDFSLTDGIIEKYDVPCIIICYVNKSNGNPDILVKEHNSFLSLSYHNI